MFLFFFNHTATTQLYTLSLHDALPISIRGKAPSRAVWPAGSCGLARFADGARSRLIRRSRSEEHTSELQSRGHLVCRLLLEKKKQGAVHQYQRNMPPASPSWFGSPASS